MSSTVRHQCLILRNAMRPSESFSWHILVIVSLTIWSRVVMVLKWCVVINRRKAWICYLPVLTLGMSSRTRFRSSLTVMVFVSSVLKRNKVFSNEFNTNATIATRHTLDKKSIVLLILATRVASSCVSRVSCQYKDNTSVLYAESALEHTFTSWRTT
jgi:hypothetical protein